jgi:2-(1,2-epoxy-1,2-dihydrophenyl)acetyl-CoA isomerase
MPHAATVLVEAEDGVAVVTLNRPERRNGLAEDMLERLHATLTRIAADGEIAVVVLRGAGADFCVGADIKAFPDGVAGKTDFRKVAPLYHVSTLLHEMPQPTIAAIDGGCAGAGLGWACACDFRFASDRAVFSTAFLKVGVAGDMGTAWSLSRVVGPARARELMYFPEKFGPAEAERIGLVTRIFPAARLHDETLRLARELAARPRFALQVMKENFLSAERLDVADYIEIEGARHSHVVVSDGATEGFRAFVKAAST